MNSAEAHNLHAGGGECLAECPGEQRISIVDQEALVSQKAVAGICQVATHLGHPGRVGLRGDPGDLDAPRRQVDDEQHANRVSPRLVPT
jgi:hypothetical protein